MSEQETHSVTYLGQLRLLPWKTPTLDALRIELLKEFILQIERASIRQLLADVCLLPLSAQKGYTMDEALEFFKRKTELVKNELGRQPILTKTGPQSVAKPN